MLAGGQLAGRGAQVRLHRKGRDWPHRLPACCFACPRKYRNSNYQIILWPAGSGLLSPSVLWDGSPLDTADGPGENVAPEPASFGARLNLDDLAGRPVVNLLVLPRLLPL